MNKTTDRFVKGLHLLVMAALLAPWLGLAAVASFAALTIAVVRRRRG